MRSFHRMLKETHTQWRFKRHNVWSRIASLRLGTRSEIPLLHAAQICADQCEGTFVADFVKTLNMKPHRKFSGGALHYYLCSFASRGVPVIGKRWAGAKWTTVLTGGDLLRTINTYAYGYADRAWIDASVPREDLWLHICWLRSVFTQEQL